jgi:hypothetical protein
MEHIAVYALVHDEDLVLLTAEILDQCLLRELRDTDESIGTPQTLHGKTIKQLIQGMAERALIFLMPDKEGHNVVYGNHRWTKVGIEPQEDGHLLRRKVL